MNKVQVAKTIIKLAKALATDSKSIRTAGAKYTFTGETWRSGGRMLYRVKYADGTLGGWIESEKNLQGDAKVLGNAQVYGNAVVKDNAIVKGSSTVHGKAIVKDNAIIESRADVCDSAIISGHAIVRKNSNVSGNVQVSDNAIICRCSTVYGNAIVSKQAKVEFSHICDATITDQAYVSNSTVNGKIKIFEKARIKNDSSIFDDSQVSGTVIHSVLRGASIIKGEVHDCRLKNEIVEQDELVIYEQDF